MVNWDEAYYSYQTWNPVDVNEVPTIV